MRQVTTGDREELHIPRGNVVFLVVLGVVSLVLWYE